MQICSRAPLRISFAGGGADVELYLSNYGGLVLSTTIDKYIYATLRANRQSRISGGGAPPVRCGDHYVSIFHSSFSVRPLRQVLFRLLHKPPAMTVRYVGGVYAFEASPPFTPRWLHPEPILSTATTTQTKSAVGSTR